MYMVDMVDEAETKQADNQLDYDQDAESHDGE
jgi:hypothetical protein